MVTIYLLRDFALGSEEEVSSQNKSILIETVCSSVIEVEVKQSGLLTHLAWVTGNYFLCKTFILLLTHLSCSCGFLVLCCFVFSQIPYGLWLLLLLGQPWRTLLVGQRALISHITTYRQHL